MVRSPLLRAAVALAAVAVLAACSDDEPEPVSTEALGIELAATTTEQPKVREEESTTTTTEEPTTTTTSTTTTTTSTTTTTTAPAPVVPPAEQIQLALPGAEALGAGEWARTAIGPTQGPGTPAPLCDGSTVPTPLSPIVYDGAVDGGAYVRYQRPDESTRVLLVVAPLADAEARVAEAQAEVGRCAVNVLGWPAMGDGSVAYSRTEEGPVGPDGVPGGQIAAWAVARVGGLVVAVNSQSFYAEGQQLAPAPTEAELQAFLTAAVESVRGITTPPPA